MKDIGKLTEEFKKTERILADLKQNSRWNSLDFYPKEVLCKGKAYLKIMEYPYGKFKNNTRELRIMVYYVDDNYRNIFRFSGENNCGFLTDEEAIELLENAIFHKIV